MLLRLNWAAKSAQAGVLMVGGWLSPEPRLMGPAWLPASLPPRISTLSPDFPFAPHQSLKFHNYLLNVCFSPCVLLGTGGGYEDSDVMGAEALRNRVQTTV